MPDSGAATGNSVGSGKLLARGIDTFFKELGASAKRRFRRPQEQAKLVEQWQPPYALTVLDNFPYAQTFLNERQDWKVSSEILLGQRPTVRNLVLYIGPEIAEICYPDVECWEC